MSVVQSSLLYGAEIWAERMTTKCYRDQLASVQRLSALRVASSFRTVSGPAVQVIASTIPIDLLARERRTLFLQKMEGTVNRPQERRHTVALWQERWNGESRGRWTARLIKDLTQWTERKHGEVGYYLTQFLTGHGYFMSYLQKIGKVPSPTCLYCPGEVDDAEHTFFHCSKWELQRDEVSSVVRHLHPDNIVEKMIRKKEVWEKVSTYVESVLRLKKPDLP